MRTVLCRHVDLQSLFGAVLFCNRSHCFLSFCTWSGIASDIYTRTGQPQQVQGTVMDGAPHLLLTKMRVDNRQVSSTIESVCDCWCCFPSPIFHGLLFCLNLEEDKQVVLVPFYPNEESSKQGGSGLVAEVQHGLKGCELGLWSRPPLKKQGSLFFCLGKNKPKKYERTILATTE